MSLNKTELLFVRACKSRDPRRRMVSVYRRQYLSPRHLAEGELQNILADILVGICSTYLRYSASDLFRDLRSEAVWAEDKSLGNLTFCAAMHRIRFASVDRFPSWKDPAYFRNANTEINISKKD